MKISPTSRRSSYSRDIASQKTSLHGKNSSYSSYSNKKPKNQGPFFPSPHFGGGASCGAQVGGGGGGGPSNGGSINKASSSYDGGAPAPDMNNAMATMDTPSDIDGCEGLHHRGNRDSRASSSRTSPTAAAAAGRDYYTTQQEDEDYGKNPGEGGATHPQNKNSSSSGTSSNSSADGQIFENWPSYTTPLTGTSFEN